MKSTCCGFEMGETIQCQTCGACGVCGGYCEGGHDGIEKKI